MKINMGGKNNIWSVLERKHKTLMGSGRAAQSSDITLIITQYENMKPLLSRNVTEVHLFCSLKTEKQLQHETEAEIQETKVLGWSLKKRTGPFKMSKKEENG